MKADVMEIPASERHKTDSNKCYGVLVQKRNPHHNVWSFAVEDTVGNWSIFLQIVFVLEFVPYVKTPTPRILSGTYQNCRISKLRPTIPSESSKTHHDGREGGR
jgi:hypothetical protein